MRTLFFGKLNSEELSSINDMLASTTLFRLVFMFYIFYYYNDLSVFEFAFWSIITEFTLCLKAISHLVIIRCKLVPQSLSFAFDQSLPICDLLKYTVLTLAISLSASSILIYQCYQFFYAHTGMIPLLCLLADTIIVVFDNVHALGLIAVHFYRKNTDIYVYYADLLCNVFAEMLRLLHYLLVIYVIGVSFSLIGVFVIMRFRTSLVNIKGNLKAYKSYQQIYQALNHQYPDATKEELIIHKKKQHSKAVPDTDSAQHEDSGDQKEDDDESTASPHSNANSSSSLLSQSSTSSTSNEHAANTDTEQESHEYELCGICRDAMTEAKKLPCSHKFHLRCLMGWMRYKHTCPICRRSLNHAGNANNENNNNQNNGNNANENANNNNNLLPWWLRLFSNFIQIHNVDIIDARNLNVPRAGAAAARGRINVAAQHRAPPNQSTEEQIGRISEILGGTVSDQEIRVRLLRTHSMERTIEYFLSRQ
eukprot:CAMPEP_0197052990 /NCGR_PEP_ID=MMETSP1384-20130603/27362_1 /TAXON_ID=29189 /ORGANISM="Ammonia sp." /LENGTH=478 /DNA_ID=CAMNT_0042485817 /DNA_START=1046 /DNA_END=2482 /DNA_ORIENTATION=-